MFTQDDVDREYARSANSCLYFGLNYCWTVDVADPSGLPRPHRIPSYPFVREFLTINQPVHNVHSDKSRQMLTSWLWMVVFLWDILFHRQWSNLVISYDEDSVDDGGSRSTFISLLGKVRYMWEHLPPFLAHTFEFKYMLVTNVDLGSFIKGETAGGKAPGRGPTNKRGLFDEAAHSDRSNTVFTGIRQSSPDGTILNSTPRGKTGIFPRVKFNPASTFDKQSWHWTLHPIRRLNLYCECGWKSRPWSEVGEDERSQFLQHAKSGTCTASRPFARSPWYDRASADYPPEDVASELDVSYEKSLRGRVWDAFNSSIHTFDHTKLVGPDGLAVGERAVTEDLASYRQRYLLAALDPSLVTFITMDPGVNDPAAVLLGQVVDWNVPRVRWIDEYEATDAGWPHYHAVMTFWLDAWQDVGGVNAVRFTGDPAGLQRGSDLSSWFSNLARAEPAMHFETPGEVDRKRPLAWLDFINEEFRRGHIEVATWCSGWGAAPNAPPSLIDCIEQYHFPLDRDGNPIPGRHLPVHDEYSHKCSAFRYAYMVFFSGFLYDNVEDAETGPEARADMVTILAMGDDQPVERAPRF